MLSGIAILLILQRSGSLGKWSFLVLPALLLFIPLAFFVVAFLAGYDLAALREAGWVAAQQPTSPNPFSVFQFFQFGLVRWELLP